MGKYTDEIHKNPVKPVKNGKKPIKLSKPSKTLKETFRNPMKTTKINRTTNEERPARIINGSIEIRSIKNRKPNKNEFRNQK